MRNRSLHWGQALADIRGDRGTRPVIREERLRTTAGIRGTPALTLSAWRGLSGRRYVVGVHDLTLDTVRDALDTVLIAVARDADGVGCIVDLATGLRFTEATEWVCRATALGACELHIHRLADVAAERIGIVEDLTAPAADMVA